MDFLANGSSEGWQIDAGGIQVLAILDVWQSNVRAGRVSIY